MEEIKYSALKTAHEESYSDGTIIGVLINTNEKSEKIDSFIYRFREESTTYIFFESIMDMNDHILYGDKKIKKAYMKEVDFDKLYDDGINGTFNDQLEWLKQESED